MPIPVTFNPLCYLCAEHRWVTMDNGAQLCKLCGKPNMDLCPKGVFKYVNGHVQKTDVEYKHPHNMVPTSGGGYRCRVCGSIFHPQSSQPIEQPGGQQPTMKFKIIFEGDYTPSGHFDGATDMTWRNIMNNAATVAAKQLERVMGSNWRVEKSTAELRVAHDVTVVRTRPWD